MFSYSPFHTNLFSRQPCTQFEVSSNSELLKFTDILDFFFISHPAFGQKEGNEFERVLYFFPESETIDKKTDVTGFAEAVVNFTGNFVDADINLPSGSDYNFRYINSTNTCEIVLVIEDGKFFIGVCLNRKLCKTHEYVPHSPTIKTILIKIYESFRLFYGTLSNLLSFSVVEIKKCLNHFFTPYLTLLRLNKIPLVDFFSGVDFMPLSNVDYLEVECLVTRCLNEFPNITYTMFLYQNKLIQYSVEKCNLIAINQFLTQNLIPFSLQSGLQPEIISKANKDEKRTGSFITGIDDYLGILSPSSFPIVHLLSDQKTNTQTYQPYELIVYHALNATVCVLIPLKNFNNLEPSTYLENLADFFDSHLCQLASRIGDVISVMPKSIQNDIPFNFIYYNSDSLSVRTSFVSSISFAQFTNVGIPSINIHKLIYETYDHFASDVKDFSQVYVKAENDWWIVFKKMNYRILILFIPLTTPSTITDVYSCTDSIIKSHFNHIFVP